MASIYEGTSTWACSSRCQFPAAAAHRLVLPHATYHGGYRGHSLLRCVVSFGCYYRVSRLLLPFAMLTVVDELTVHDHVYS